MHLVRNLGLLLLFVVVGLLAGVGGKQLYQQWDQNQRIQHHDYADLLAAHGVEVVLFSTATCPYCTQARQALGELGIRYRELDIDASATADAAFKALGERGVPVLVTRDRLIRGFQPEAYRDLAPRSDGPPSLAPSSETESGSRSGP